MLIPNPDGTVSVGPRDIVGVLRDSHTGRYHVCLWLESPLPGDALGEASHGFIRLKSRVHHTAGADTFEGMLEQLVEFRKKYIVADSNVLAKPEHVVTRNFPEEGAANILIIRTEDFPS